MQHIGTKSQTYDQGWDPPVHRGRRRQGVLSWVRGWALVQHNVLPTPPPQPTHQDDPTLTHIPDNKKSPRVHHSPVHRGRRRLGVPHPEWAAGVGGCNFLDFSSPPASIMQCTNTQHAHNNTNRKPRFEPTCPQGSQAPAGAELAAGVGHFQVCRAAAQLGLRLVMASRNATSLLSAGQGKQRCIRV